MRLRVRMLGDISVRGNHASAALCEHLCLLLFGGGGNRKHLRLVIFMLLWDFSGKSMKIGRVF